MFLLLAVLLLVSLAVPSLAQLSVSQKKDASKIQAMLQQQQDQTDDLVTALLHVANEKKQIMNEQDAVDLAAILQQAAADPETQDMIVRMQTEEKDTLAQLKATSNMENTILGLVQVLEDMKMLEIVFADKERALRLMQEEGMVDPQRVPQYQQNPDLLEEDTRKGLYFTFVTLAITAGFL